MVADVASNMDVVFDIDVAFDIVVAFDVVVAFRGRHLDSSHRRLSGLSTCKSEIQCTWCTPGNRWMLTITLAPWLVVAFVAYVSVVVAFAFVVAVAVAVIFISAAATTVTAVEEELAPSLL